MPSQVLSSVENNFTKGLVTEFTGLNFPENAATDADNVEFTLVGDTVRRLGIDLELNVNSTAFSRVGNAENTYVWKNVGGDGNTQLLVVQVGGTLRFYSITNATLAAPLSTQILGSSITVSNYTVVGGSFNSALECEFADGDGYLFVFHPNCEPFFCTYNAGTITANIITLKIRDFTDVLESGVAVNTRPTTLTSQHLYNLTNRGWTQGSAWLGQSSTATPTVVASGSVGTTIGTGLAISLGDIVVFSNVNTIFPGGQPPIPSGTALMSGNVTAYNSGTGSITVNITGSLAAAVGLQLGPYNITPNNIGYVNNWFASIGNYPSLADVWWYFKNTAGSFDPGTTLNQVTLNTGSAPQGHFILDAFTQKRTLISSISGLTDVITTKRPRTGTWFQGRVWYTGVDASQQATGDSNFYTWTEKIYFSKIVNTPDDFGKCYQTNDPVSENLFGLLATDGGVISIQGAGSIYKLIPVQSGLLVFAANGVWFITGSQGIGFAANDYTVTKVSNIKTTSGSSFVNVQGLPYFWNEEGIYAVEIVDVRSSERGGIQVSSITYSTIDSLYSEIPLSCKRLARGDYDPINYTIKWVYRSTEPSTTKASYEFDKIINYNVANKAFYIHTVDTSFANINGIKFISTPGGSTAPASVFKYLTSYPSGGNSNVQFSEERDTNYIDWASTAVPVDYESYFVTGYKLHGQGQRRFQLNYVYVYSRTNEDPVSYYIQGLWDYANSGNSGRWSTAQYVLVDDDYSSMSIRRHKIRGQGLVLQIKIKSVSGQPFDIMGWSAYETQNTGV